MVFYETKGNAVSFIRCQIRSAEQGRGTPSEKEKPGFPVVVPLYFHELLFYAVPTLEPFFL